MTVRLDVDDGVATVTIDSPPVNSLSDAVVAGLTAAAEALSADPDARAVVVAGMGTKAFTAGADLRQFREMLGHMERMERHTARTRPLFDAWWELPQPVVAAVNAHAMGGGLEFALLCDFIVADPRARFGLPEVTLGLMPGGGGTQRLAQRVGRATATEMILLGEPIDAVRASELGLVSRVAGEGRALEEAQALAARLAALPAVAVRSAKRAVRAGWETPLPERLDLERALFLAVAASADAREGTEAFLDRREPRFRHA